MSIFVLVFMRNCWPDTVGFNLRAHIYFYWPTLTLLDLGMFLPVIRGVLDKDGGWGWGLVTHPPPESARAHT